MKTKNTLHIWLVLCLVTGFLLYASTLTHAESLPFSLDTEYAELDGHPAAVLWVTPQKGYHTYSHYADAPIPTSLNILDAQGQPAAAAVLYPQGGLRPTPSSPQNRFSPIPPGSRSSSVSMPPYPAPSPPICPCSSVRTKTVSPYSKRSPWHSPKRCLRRAPPRWRRMGNSVKPKHPPSLPNPLLRKPPHSNPSPR